MTRSALTLAAAAVLCTLAAADAPPAGPTAAEQLKLLKSNRDLLEDLIDHGINVSKPATILDRTNECRKAAGTLANALARAAEESSPDADRVVELSEHLGSLWSDGLTPNLQTATAQIPPESPEYGRLKDVSKWAAADAAKVQLAIPADGRLARSPKVQKAREQLAAAAAQLAAAAPKADAK